MIDGECVGSNIVRNPQPGQLLTLNPFFRPCQKGHETWVGEARPGLTNSDLTTKPELEGNHIRIGDFQPEVGGPKGAGRRLKGARHVQKYVEIKSSGFFFTFKYDTCDIFGTRDLKLT